MRTCFFSVSLKNRPNLQIEIEKIKYLLDKYSFNINVFVDEYVFSKGEEKKMMNTACIDITNADLLIAEVSEKAIGVGIEVGFAVALNKPVIYLRQDSSEYSSTIGGIVENHIIYKNVDDLEIKLDLILKELYVK